MTLRLYYHNPYATSFEASIVKSVRIDQQPAVILDKTHFYPTSGGQPCDLGVMNGVRVVDVLVRDEDEALIHRLESEISGDRVQAEIDWPRRFDHMQQHTGQHILSAAFEELFQAETVGFHMGPEASTIDLASGHMSSDELGRVEELANDIVCRDLPVLSSIVPQQQAVGLAFRRPLQVSGRVRVVEVEGFDLAACGGTHVRHTGEVGMIKIIKLERQRGGLRATFLCGRRALADYQFKNQLVITLSNAFTVANQDLAGAIDRLGEDAKGLRHQLRKANERLVAFEAQELLLTADEYGVVRIVSAACVDRGRNELNALSRALVSQPSVVALLGMPGSKPHLVFARSPEVDVDMRAVLSRALQVLSSKAGGGRPELAQGGGAESDRDQIEHALDCAKQELIARLT